MPSKDLRVLILSHMYPRPSFLHSGIFAHQQVRILNRKGIEVIVVSPVPWTAKFVATNDRRESYLKTPHETTIDGIRVFYPRYLRLPGAFFHAPSCLTMCWGSFKLVSNIVKEFKPNIIHAYSATPSGYAGILLKKHFNLPIVVSLLGSDINVYPYRDEKTFEFTKRVLREAERIISVSEVLKNEAEQIEKTKKEIEVIYMGCDLELFNFNANKRFELRNEHIINPNDFVLLFIGSLIRSKGVFELAEAFYHLTKRYNNVRLFLVGIGTDEKDLRGLFTSYGIADKVFFVGPVPHNEIPNWLSFSDVLVLPTLYEGLPNVVLESMACERPVVATKVGGIPEAVEDGESGILVEKGDVNGLIQAIVTLIENPDLRLKMGQAGRKIVEERFSWDISTNKLIKVYEEVILNGF